MTPVGQLTFVLTACRSLAFTCLAATFLSAVPAAVQEQCRPYRTSESWSSSRTILGFTPNEVCSGMVAADYPMQSGNTTIHGVALGAVPWLRYPGNFLCRVERSAFRTSGQYAGLPVPEESGIYEIDGIGGNSCPLSISLAGDSLTRALPAGPVLPQTAQVTENGAPAVGKNVSISVGSSGALSGTTDDSGQFHFTYVPPHHKATVDHITASCAGCSNTARKQITVEACAVCDSGVAP